MPRSLPGGRSRPRDVTTEVETHLSVDWQKVACDQSLPFDVRYQPLSELAFELPLGWSIVDDQIEIVSGNDGRRRR